MPKSLNKPVVISFGRFNPPTTGHAALISFVVKTAKRLNAHVIIFPSVSQDPKKNPLPFREKVQFLRQFWPEVQFSDNNAIRTPVDALQAVSQAGYTHAYVVVGSDRAAEFQKFGKYVREKGPADKYILLQGYEVVPVPGERDPDADGVAGMSASKLRAAATSGDWETFRSGVHTKSDTVAKQLYKAVRRHMGLKEAAITQCKRCHGNGEVSCSECKGSGHVNYKQCKPCHGNGEVSCPDCKGRGAIQEEKRVFFVYSTIAEDAKPLMEALKGVPAHVENVTGLTFLEIKRLYETVVSRGFKPTFYVRASMQREKGPIQESLLRAFSVVGRLDEQKWHRVKVQYKTTKEIVEGVRAHAQALCEKTGDVIKPKQPSEVDRLKDNQKRQLLLIKQRQAQDMLQAQQRELTKKSREDQNKIQMGSKHPSVTR